MNNRTYKKTLDRWVCIDASQVIDSERIRHLSILMDEFKTKADSSESQRGS